MTLCRTTLQRMFYIIAGLLLARPNVLAGAKPISKTWQPDVSEQLVRLSTLSPRHSIGNDFSKSPLANVIRDQVVRIRIHKHAIARLRAATGQVKGGAWREQSLGLLVEKTGLVQLLGDGLSLERRAWRIRAGLYSALLRKARLNEEEAREARRTVAASAVLYLH